MRNFDIGWKTEPGKVRAENQDDLVVRASRRPQGRTLLAIADGVGGTADGARASQQAIKSLTNRLARSRERSISDALRDGFEAANRSVRRLGRARPPSSRPASTLVAAAIVDEECYVASVGDSRAYLGAASTFRRLTRDHTIAQEQVERGAIVADDVILHPGRTSLTRRLGESDSARATIVGPIHLDSGDTIILCTDGLHAVLADEEIAALSQGLSAQRAADAMVELANARGGPDNITVIVARLRTNGHAN